MQTNSKIKNNTAEKTMRPQTLRRVSYPTRQQTQTCSIFFCLILSSACCSLRPYSRSASLKLRTARCWMKSWAPLKCEAMFSTSSVRSDGLNTFTTDTLPSRMRHHFCLSGAVWIHGFLICNTDFTRLHFASFLPTLTTNSVKCPYNVMHDSVTLSSALLTIIKQ